MKIVMIGNGPAAIRALEAIASYQSDLNVDELDITMVSGESTPPYSPMFLADYLTRELDKDGILLVEKHGLSPVRLLGSNVIGLKDNEKKVLLDNGEEISFDRLLIASGTSQIIPPIAGTDKDGVHYFNRLGDVTGLSRQLPITRKIIVIGAGLTGIEAAIAFNEMGKEVLVVESFSQCLPQMLDKDLADIVEKRLSDLGIRFLLGESVSEITGNKRADGIIVGDREIAGDLVLLASGVTPNIDFISSSRVKVNRGVLVNQQMQTSVPGIYAAGDVAESIDPYGSNELVLSWYNAVEQGWTAGCNIIGNESKCPFSPGLAVLKGVEKPVVSVGRIYDNIEYETLYNAKETAGIHERIYLNDDIIDCYQAIGTPDRVGLMYGYIKERKDISGIKDLLLDCHLSAALVA
jgi:NAD(P)H-nitrite reductase large subunit